MFRSFPRKRESRATARRAGKAKRARVFCGGHGHSALKTRVNALSLRLCPPYAYFSIHSAHFGTSVEPHGMIGTVEVEFFGEPSMMRSE
jgi:hypothetical protein